MKSHQVERCGCGRPFLDYLDYCPHCRAASSDENHGICHEDPPPPREIIEADRRRREIKASWSYVEERKRCRFSVVQGLSVPICHVEREIEEAMLCDA